MSDEAKTLGRNKLARGLKLLLDVLFYAVLLVAVLLLVSLPVSISSGYHDGWDLIVPVAIGAGSFSPRLDLQTAPHSPTVFEVARISDGGGDLHLFHHRLPLHLVNSAVQLPFLGMLVWAVALLRRILATTAKGLPFDPLNPRRLNSLGWIIIGTSVLRSLLHFFASKWALTQVEITSVPVSPVVQTNKEWLLCGLLVLVLAAIWKQAVQMAEEQALTV